MPKVTVLMCVYNGGTPLYSAIESILNQTFKEFELLIVDDGSIDDTPAILGKYAERDSRVRVVPQKNQGLTHALNVGLAAAAGEYIARQDADDLSMPERLEHQVGFLDKNSQVVLVGCDYDVIDDDGGQIVTIRNSRKRDLMKSLVKSNPFAHGSIMFRREVDGDPVGYQEFYKKAQDRDFIFRMAEKGEVGIVPEVLYRWRFSRKGILATNVTFYGRRAVENYQRRQEGLEEDFSPPSEEDIRAKPSDAHLQMALGVRLLSGYRVKEARKSLWRAAVMFGPREPGFRAALKLIVVSFLPTFLLRHLRER